MAEITYGRLSEFNRGRNGWFKSKGLILFRGADEVRLMPISSLDAVGACAVGIPIDSIDAVIQTRQELKKETQNGRQRNE